MRLNLSLAAAIAVLASGCGTIDRYSEPIATRLTPYRVEIVQGNFVSKEQVGALREGMSRQQVRDILGTPLVADAFHNSRWDYVFTIRRQGAEPQLRRVVVRFKADLLDSVEGGAGLPSEHEFVVSIDTFKTARNAPPLVLSDEQIKALPVPVRPPPADPTPPVPARTYPPLEPSP